MDYNRFSMKSFLVLALVFASCSAQARCGPGSAPYPPCKKDWNIGLDHVRPSGTRVHGHINTPMSSSGLQGTVHGSHVFGGPYKGAQTVGGGLNYQHPSGIYGGVDMTHTKGLGNVVSGHVGGSTKLGPGTLSIQGGANTVPHSGKVEGSVGATYSVPLF